jgi:23S rRNA pseudouridine1911/1915/1917 synthase
VSERHIRVIVEAGGGRLDQVLASYLQDQSRNRLQQFIRDGRIFVDGERTTKPAFHLKGGEVIECVIPPPKPYRLQAEEIPLDILFENQDLIVINKPAGMVVHPSAGHETGTLVHAILAHAPDILGVGGEQRPGVVHRLDKDTSGILLFAKHDIAHRFLQQQFSQRKAEKTYLALVDGAPPTPAGCIDASIGRDPNHRKQMAVLAAGKGRPAVTHYREIENYQRHTLLEVRPITGRTHQIRLHLAFLNCPVVGDRVYGQRKPSLPIRRLFLHAARLRICIPGEEKERTFDAPLPEELCLLLENLSFKTRPGEENI